MFVSIFHFLLLLSNNLSGGHRSIWKNGIRHKRANTWTMAMVFVLWYRHLIMGSSSHYNTNKKTTKNTIVRIKIKCDFPRHSPSVFSVRYKMVFDLYIFFLCFFVIHQTTNEWMNKIDGAEVIQNNTLRQLILVMNVSTH